MSQFTNNRTVEQLKAETKSTTLNFNYATKDGKPLLHKDSQVQMVAINNKAGQNVAWCSKEIAAEIAQGKNPAKDSRGLAVVDVITDDGDVFTKLVHPSASNRIEGLSL